MKFTTGQRRLEHITGIHCAIRLPGSHHGVQFVNKQNYPAFLLGQLIQHCLKTLFKLTAVFCSSN